MGPKMSNAPTASAMAPARTTVNPTNDRSFIAALFTSDKGMHCTLDEVYSKALLL